MDDILHIIDRLTHETLRPVLQSRFRDRYMEAIKKDLQEPKDMTRYPTYEKQLLADIYNDELPKIKADLLSTVKKWQGKLMFPGEGRMEDEDRGCD